MDFLDPKKRRAHAIRLMVGYVLLAIAILLGTTVLLYQANGFDVRRGKIIQNGLVFVSSRPSGAQIYLDGKKKDSTGARLTLPAGTYKMELLRKGYDNWQRAVSVEGNSVERIDYPLLIPSTLTTTTTASYEASASLAFQTPDRRWLLANVAGKPLDFYMYDLKNPKQVAQTVKRVSVPGSVLTDQAAPGSLNLVEASNDNRHILLSHSYTLAAGVRTEYILFDRQDPTQTRNLTTDFKLPEGTVVSLQDKKYDRYFLHDTNTQALGTVNLSNPTTTVPVAKKVLAFKSYSDDTAVYATPNPASPVAKTDIKLAIAGKTYQLRTVAADKKYLLDIAKYDGKWFVVAGASAENRVYIYKNPTDMLTDKPTAPLVPVDVLKVDQPDYVKFSANTQFIMAAHGSQFAVYDAEYDKHYSYDTSLPVDLPATHAEWMDGNRLAYVSNGKVIEFDYDGTNRHTLSAAAPGFYYYDRDYKFLYTFAAPASVAKPSATTLQILTSTSLLTADDQ